MGKVFNKYDFVVLQFEITITQSFLARHLIVNSLCLSCCSFILWFNSPKKSNILQSYTSFLAYLPFQICISCLWYIYLESTIKFNLFNTWGIKWFYLRLLTFIYFLVIWWVIICLLVYIFQPRQYFKRVHIGIVILKISVLISDLNYQIFMWLERTV